MQLLVDILPRGSGYFYGSESRKPKSWGSIGSGSKTLIICNRYPDMIHVCAYDPDPLDLRKFGSRKEIFPLTTDQVWTRKGKRLSGVSYWSIECLAPAISGEREVSFKTLLYRVTFKVWNFRDDYTDFSLCFFIHGFL